MSKKNVYDYSETPVVNYSRTPSYVVPRDAKGRCEKKDCAFRMNNPNRTLSYCNYFFVTGELRTHGMKTDEEKDPANCPHYKPGARRKCKRSCSILGK